MKALASTILNQRTEMEQFFLESLQEVRDVIRRERLVTKKKGVLPPLLNNNNSQQADS
jgi:hypothetical protein